MNKIHRYTRESHVLVALRRVAHYQKPLGVSLTYRNHRRNLQKNKIVVVRVAHLIMIIKQSILILKMEMLPLKSIRRRNNRHQTLLLRPLAQQNHRIRQK